MRIGIFALCVAPLAAVAQGDTTIRVFVKRGITPFEQQLERLAFELVARRQSAFVLADRLREAQAGLATLGSDPDRPAAVNTIRVLRTRLANVNADRQRLQEELSALCPRDRQPEGWMGVAYLSDATFEMSPRGIVVTRFAEYPGVESVERGSPAEKAGIQRGDRLLAIGGIDLRGGELSFRALLKPGAKLPVRILRGVDTKNLTVTIEPRPADYEVPCAWFDEQLWSALSDPRDRPNVLFRLEAGGGVAVVDTPAQARRVEVRAGQRATGESLTILPGDASYVYSFRLGGETAWAVGAQLSPLNGDLARALGAERGVLVLDVSRRSPAAQSGLRGGDVILTADGQVLLRPSDLLERMNASAPRELKLEVLRLKKIEAVTLRWRGDGPD